LNQGIGILIAEVAVPESLLPVALAQPLPDQREEMIAHVVVGWATVGIETRRVGEGVAVIAAVGSVEIDEEIGLPLREESQRPASLGRLELHIVAVEVETLAVGVAAHDGGTILSRAVLLPGGKVIVAVGIVDRDHQQDDAVEQGTEVTEREVTQQHLRRFFSFDFAGVDVALDVQDGFAAAVGRAGRIHHRPGGDHVGDSPSLGTRAQGPDPKARAEPLERIEKGQNIRVGRGLAELRALRARGLCGERRADEHRPQQQPAQCAS
jgi:hypothetical protein